MKKPTERLISALVFIFLLAIPARAADYFTPIRDAISSIELGEYDKAASAVQNAFAIDDTDPLGHTVLGVIYLHAGKLDEAQSEFRQVVAVNPDDWRSCYALALIALVQKRPEDAEKRLASVADLSAARDEIAALRTYLSFVKGDTRQLSSIQTPSGLLAVQTLATQALKAARSDRAISLFKEVLQAPVSPGFEENRGPIATFDEKHPVVLPNGKLTWKAPERKDAPVVSGLVTLRADIGKTGGVSLVTFYVDGVFAGVTNYERFQFDWKTTGCPNGLHQITMEGKDKAGNIISKKSVWVRVSNARPEKNPPRTGAEVAEVNARLWNSIRLSESRKLAHYRLAKVYLDAKAVDNAVRQLEYVVAYQPDFADARKLLNSLRSWPAKYAEIERGPSGSKKIALTFDDGPNERSGELLDMLTRLNVPATFFVVGFRAEEQPELMRALHLGGHQIENHTYSHPRLTTLTADQVESELSKAAAVIRAITGQPARYFRPPGGHTDEATKEGAARQGFIGVYWTVSCSPYEGAEARGLAEHVIKNASDGGIIQMHNGEPAATSALPKIVEELRSQGYTFVTLSALLSKGKAK